MNEYCVTFLSGGDAPAEVFHCHVVAPSDLFAVEGAMRGAAEQNISLVQARSVGVRMLLELPADVMQALEAIRVAQYGATPAPTVSTSHHVH